MLSQRLPLRVQRRSSAASVSVRPKRTALIVRAANPAAGTKYDYIIVGGGTAGCVLANQLSESGNKNILVLEAGGDGKSSNEVSIPAGITKLFKHPTMDWGLSSNTQQQLLAREMYLARGKTLGGSSCTNATLYHRGSAADYDSWGLEGWTSKDVLEWFKRSEDFPDSGNPAYHGTGGLMHVERPRYENSLHEHFFESCRLAGMKHNPDFNDWSRPQLGYGEFHVTQDRGQRADLNRRALQPIMGRNNLKVVTDARTKKIVFNNEGGKKISKGVEFSVGGPFGEHCQAELAPGGEVLLCAGAVHSPHILQLSGIGAASDLTAHGIDVVSDLPGVGKNLQDHPACLVAEKMTSEFEKLSFTDEVYDDKNNVKITQLLNYMVFRKGPLATTGCDHGGFASTDGSGEADLQLRFVPACSLDPDGVVAYAKFGELKKMGFKWPGGFTIQLLAVRAKSTGSVGLKSADPFNNPDININYFQDAADMETLKNGVKLARKIMGQTPLRQYIREEAYPGAARESDADIEAYIRRTVHSGNALVGTCKMGKSAADGSVVSSKDMKVHGVEGLRVIDTSVIPRIPGGQTGAPAVMIAKRMAAQLA